MSKAPSLLWYVLTFMSEPFPDAAAGAKVRREPPPLRLKCWDRYEIGTYNLGARRKKGLRNQSVVIPVHWPPEAPISRW